MAGWKAHFINCKFCLLPARVGEVVLNRLGGIVVGLPVVSKMVSKLKIGDVKLNFTQQIKHGPGAFVSDFKEGLAHAAELFSHLATKKD